jgi:hypothetical protein
MRKRTTFNALAKKPEPNPNLTYHEVKVVGDDCKS